MFSTFASQPLSSSQQSRNISNTTSNIRTITNTSRLFTNSLDPISIKIPNKIKISKKILNQLIADLGSESFDSTRTNINYINNNSKNSSLLSNTYPRSSFFLLKDNQNIVLKNLLDLCIIYESIYNMNKNILQSYIQGNNWVYLIIVYLTQEQLIKPELSNINASISLKLIIIYQLVFNDCIKITENKINNIDIDKITDILKKYLPLPSQQLNDSPSFNDYIYSKIHSEARALFQGRNVFYYNENDGNLIDNLDFYKNLFMNICKIYESSFDNTVLEYNNLPPVLNNYSVYKQKMINPNKKINLMTFEYIFVWLLNIIKKIKFRNPTDPYNYPEIVALPDFSIQDNFNLYFELKAFKASLN
jgi:hypothetical protein